MDEALIASFVAAFDAGVAHSVEIWDRSGALAGGIFGFAIGRVFFTEGCFARARDASKVGFVALNCHLQRWGYLMNDGKHLSGRLCQLGFLPVQRAAFEALLAMACTGTGQEGRWAVDQTLNLAAWNPRAMSALH
jgi:leucyl/phenylalanyl-tRNA--protein transferase